MTIIDYLLKTKRKLEETGDDNKIQFVSISLSVCDELDRIDDFKVKRIGNELRMVLEGLDAKMYKIYGTTWIVKIINI